MKLRNLTGHAIQFMFETTKNEGQPEFDFVHIPPDMGKGFVIVDDEIWKIISEQTIKVPRMVEETVEVEGVMLDNKPLSYVEQVPTGEFYKLNVVKNLLKNRQLEIVETEDSGRLPKEVEMIDELNSIGLSVADDIDSGKLARLHAKLFGDTKSAVLTPAK